MSVVTGIARKSITYATRMASQHALGGMNSLVLIERTAGYDELLREYGNDAVTTIYDNALVPGSGAEAGITPTAGPSSLELGEEIQHYDTINVYLPQSIVLLPRLEDLVTVVFCPDTDLSGRLFKVNSVEVGGRIYASKHLVCEGITPSQNWVP